MPAVVDLRAERLNRGLSAAEAAKRMKIGHKNTLLRAEAGSTPRPQTAFKIASFYGYQVTEVWPIPEPEEVAA